MYLGAQPHVLDPSSVDLDSVTNSHYNLLGSVLGRYGIRYKFWPGSDFFFFFFLFFMSNVVEFVICCTFFNSNERAQEAIFYSYNRNINGFAAILDEEEAAQISSKNSNLILSIEMYRLQCCWKSILELLFYLQFPLFFSVSHNGFAYAIAEDPNVLSVFPNRGRKLHTTRSWDFLGLEENGEVRRGSIWKKAQFGANTIIGNLDTGNLI